MKLRHVIVVTAIPIVVYSGLSVPIAADAGSATCCADNSDCTVDYRCDYSHSCGTLPGQCIRVPMVDGARSR